MELGTVRDWLVSDWLVSFRCEVGGVMFDASLHADVIRRSHISFWRLGHAPGLFRYSCGLRIIS